MNAARMGGYSHCNPALDGSNLVSSNGAPQLNTRHMQQVKNRPAMC